jgi:hypothetical protein
LYLSFNNGLYDNACNVKKISHTRDQDENGEYFSGRTGFMHLHKAHRGDGYGCHIGGIQKIPFFDQHISEHADKKNYPGKDNGPENLLKSVHGGINTDLHHKNQGKDHRLFAVLRIWGVKQPVYLDGRKGCWY